MSLLQFDWKAYDRHGTLKDGRLSAESEREALQSLKNRHLTPIKLEAVSESAAKRRNAGKKIRSQDILEFTKGLRTLVEARVPLDKALRLLEGITESSAMRAMVAAMRRDVKEGKSLADAMEQRPDTFSRMYINIVRAGEEGGILHQLLPGLTEFLETSAKNRQALVSAMIYPMVLLVTGVLSVVLLLVFVIPQFAIMFEDAGSEIPASAAFLLGLSDAIKSWGWLFVVSVAAVIIWWRWQRSDPDWQLRADRTMLNTPLLGHLLRYRESAVFARTLGALLGAGIPLIRALRVAREVVSNRVLANVLSSVEEDVRGGTALGMAMEKTAAFPNLLHQLVTVGEESGRIAQILIKTADTFDQQVKNQMDKLVSALQPGLILVLGIAVGGITITMLSAVFSMNSVQF
ncbi:MAG: type II secretion system F family protein [Pseudohongiella nitratireducens]|nr:type II secretion system F family protein [Pseudohongiella nitratireducens]MDF1621946.1 type II secretion system F family protein [Pseudohongiella nitratireducens]